MSGKVAVVTGASSGIGAGIARAMASAGARVVLVARNRERLAEVAGAIRGGGGACQVVAVDITTAEAPGRVVEATLAAFGRIDVLVNAAGVFRPVPLEQTPLVVLDEQWAVNVRAPFALTQAAVPHIGPGGSVLFLSSVSGHVGAPAAPAYSATKGALISLTQSLAVALAPRGIRVNAIAPGNVLTPMNERIFADTAAREETLARTPAGRIGRVEDIASAAVFLASDAASYIQGVSLVVDGGLAIYRGGMQMTRRGDE